MEKNVLLVINVLKSAYYNDCHIKGSVSIPLNQLDDYVKDFDRQKPIVVYCSSYTCSASAAAWRKLSTLGFKNVEAYEGGMNEWYHAGLPFVGSCIQSYLAQPVVRSEKVEPGIREVSMRALEERMKSAGLL